MNDISHEDRDHADASPSSASAWLQCPSYVTQTRGRKRPPSVYAKEGTAAHMLAERELKGNISGATIDVGGEAIEITEEMRDAVGVYVRIIDNLMAVCDGGHGIEMRLSGSAFRLAGVTEGVFGTADFTGIQGNTLIIVDFKYGAGVPVSARSPQLMLYGFMALGKITKTKIDKIQLMVVQPRAGGVDTCTFTFAELTGWIDTVVVPALKRIDANDHTEVVGDHCRWCVRAGECAGLHKKAQAVAKISFDVDAPDAPRLPPDPAKLTGDELGDILDQAELISAWVSKVRAEVSARLDAGNKVEGWKLVPKRAIRKWLDETMTFDVLQDAGLTEAEIMEDPSVRSPAQIEALAKRKRVKVDLEPLVTKESSGTTLVREKDDRVAIETGPKKVFSVVEDDGA